jgi:hypothetical protein
VVLVSALFVLLASALVIAADGVLDVPSGLVAAALVVALLGVGTVAVASWRQSRRSGVGVFRATGRAIKAAARLVADLF